jgi:alcohol dehydrogenase class IV
MPAEALEFVYTSLPSRVVFGPGSLSRIGDEADRLGARRILVLTTPEQEALGQRAAEALGERAVAVFPGAVMHVPIAVAEAARAQATRLDADCVAAVGGGSTIGLAKAIVLTTGLPILAVPTTYAGSEMTPIWGLTEAGEKRTGRDARVMPKTVIYDAELTSTLPPALSAISGMNAIAHSVEALYAEDANPIVSTLAEQSIAALADALPRIVADPSDVAARSKAQYGCWLAGVCLGSVGMALHHKLCHTLGGTFSLPHAEVHTIVLPHAAAFNREAAPDAMAAVARALGAWDAPAGLYDLAQRLGAPLRLADLGMREADLDRAADLAVRNPYFNPRPVTREAVRMLLQDAFDGKRPQIPALH